MKVKLAVMYLAFLIVLSACSGGGIVKKELTLEIVTQAMENEGLKLLGIHPKGKSGDSKQGIGLFDELNNVGANTYAIDRYAMDKTATANGPFEVNVYIYVFDSEQARIDGSKDLNSKLEFAKLISNPSVYEKKNVMVVFFKDPNEKAKYEDMMKKAVENL